MPNIDTLDVLSINLDTIARQYASHENTDKRRTSGQLKRAVSTESREPETCRNKMHAVVYFCYTSLLTNGWAQRNI